MYVLSSSVPINPAGAAPLRPDQVWAGLVLKAENAVPFVPGMEYCRIVERFDGGLVREVSFRGQAMRERVTFHPPVQVRFDREDGNRGTWVTNVISESPFGPLLTFTFGVTFDGVAENSPEERDRGDAMKAAYVAAIEATLGRVRQLAREGAL
jgi:hypothetical protein